MGWLETLEQLSPVKKEEDGWEKTLSALTPIKTPGVTSTGIVAVPITEAEVEPDTRDKLTFADQYPEELRPLLDTSRISPAQAFSHPSTGLIESLVGYNRLSPTRRQEIAFEINLEKLPADSELRLKGEKFKAVQKETQKRMIAAGLAEGPREYQGFWDELGRNIAGGSLNVASGVTGTLAATSWNESALWDKGQLDSVADYLYEKGKGKEFSPGAGGGWKGFVAASVGQALPYMTASVGATLVTRTPVAAFGVGFAVEGDNAYRDALAAGATEEQAQMNRLIVGTINGAVESLQVSNVIKFAKEGRGSFQALIKAARARAWKQVLAAGKELTYLELQQIIREGLEEGIQETVSVSSEARINPDVLKKGVGKRIWSSVLGGGVVGGIFGAGGMLSGGIEADLGVEPAVGPTPSVTPPGLSLKDLHRQTQREQQTRIEEDIERMDAEYQEVVRPPQAAPVTEVAPTPTKVPPKAAEGKTKEAITTGGVRIPEGSTITSMPRRAGTGSPEIMAESESITVKAISQGKLPKNYQIFDRGEFYKDAYGLQKPVKPEKKYGILTDKGINTGVYGATPQKAIENYNKAQKRPQVVRKPDYLVRLEKGKGDKDDIQAVASDILMEKFGWPQQSAKSEAEYFSRDDGRRIRLAQHDVVYPESDVDLVVSIGKSPDADIIIPESVSSEKEIRDIIDKAVTAPPKAAEGKVSLKLSDPIGYLELQSIKLTGLEVGLSPEQIDNDIREWAEHYEVDFEQIENEFVGAEPIKIRQITKMADGEQKEAALDALARENINKKLRREAVEKVKEVLKANNVHYVAVDEVQEIQADEDVPFEMRGKPVGAAVITPSGKEIVYLAYGADSETGYHEGYHVLRRRLSKQDINILGRRFKGEEAEAAAFADYMRTGKAETTMLRHIWEKLVKILNKIKSALEGKGFRTVEDIFGELGQGRVQLAAEPVRGFGTAHETKKTDADREELKRAAIKAERARLKVLTERKRHKARLRSRIKI